MTTTPQRLDAIRVLGDDEFRDVLVMDDAVENLLGEVDTLRAVVRSLAVLLRSTRDRVNQGRAPDVAGLHCALSATEEIVRGWQA
ncbi:hypothetical protein ACEZCY_15395 [Streptacidiphilus sp. N1-12]|uniref:Uncharacterized protein n=2 Tax=Streptacidiphilus alkalitolerans TaxID=3342712 RepID=A0ABV6VB72_9ACTN